MTAPSYSALRTALAKKMGLGKRVVRKSIVAA
jgi:predicted transcriptional regulator